MICCLYSAFDILRVGSSSPLSRRRQLPHPLSEGGDCPAPGHGGTHYLLSQSACCPPSVTRPAPPLCRRQQTPRDSSGKRCDPTTAQRARPEVKGHLGVTTAAAIDLVTATHPETDP